MTKLSPDEMIRMVAEAAEPAAASFGLALWGIEMEGAGRPVVRVYVEAPGQVSPDPSVPAAKAVPSAPSAPSADESGESPTPASVSGVSIDDCAEISRMVGLALDVEDVFPDAWVLEVSSPGMDRLFFTLEQMVPYVGRLVDVTLRVPSGAYAGRRKFRGALSGVDVAGGGLTVRVEGPDGAPFDAALAFADIRKARLEPVFPDTSKPRPGKRPGQGGGSHES